MALPRRPEPPAARPTTAPTKPLFERPSVYIRHSLPNGRTPEQEQARRAWYDRTSVRRAMQRREAWERWRE
jgi:hypothetical protein